MKVAKVIGNIWATKKEDSLAGYKLLLIQYIDVSDGSIKGNPEVAVDMIDAGVGETVIVVSGSSARNASGNTNLPVDATIVGIVDGLDIDGKKIKE